MVVVAGIDPGSGSTGLAVHVDGAARVCAIRSSHAGHSVNDRFRRYESHITEIIGYLDQWKPDRIYIEEYAFSANSAFKSVTIEHGALLRWHLMDLGQVLEVNLSTAKKFMTGHGNASKKMVAAKLGNRYGVKFDTDDEYDAFGLLQLGLCVEGIKNPVTDAQKDSVGKVCDRLGRVAPWDAELLPF